MAKRSQREAGDGEHQPRVNRREKSDWTGKRKPGVLFAKKSPEKMPDSECDAFSQRAPARRVKERVKHVMQRGADEHEPNDDLEDSQWPLSRQAHG